MYGDKLLEHFRNPYNMGKIENPDGVGKAGNRSQSTSLRSDLAYIKKVCSFVNFS